MDEVAANQLRTPRAAVEPAFMTDDAATEESTKGDDCAVVPENDAKRVTTKELPISAPAVSPPPRRQTSEPISQVSSTLLKGKRLKLENC
jgi:hypothetical protein